MGAVIPLVEADELGPRPLAPNAVELPGELERDFDAVGPARGKEAAGHPIRAKEFCQQIGQLNRLVVGGPAKGRIIGQRIQLRGNRRFDRPTGIAQVHVPQTAHRVDGPAPVQIGDVDPLASRQDRRWVGHAVGRVGHRMPELLCVVFLEKIAVFHDASRTALGVQIDCTSAGTVPPIASVMSRPRAISSAPNSASRAAPPRLLG